MRDKRRPLMADAQCKQDATLQDLMAQECAPTPAARAPAGREGPELEMRRAVRAPKRAGRGHGRTEALTNHVVVLSDHAH